MESINIRNFPNLIVKWKGEKEENRSEQTTPGVQPILWREDFKREVSATEDKCGRCDRFLWLNPAYTDSEQNKYRLHVELLGSWLCIIWFMKSLIFNTGFVPKELYFKRFVNYSKIMIDLKWFHYSTNSNNHKKWPSNFDMKA